jgi:CheY-like chemotaxis protein
MMMDSNDTQATRPATAVVVTEREEVHAAVAEALSPAGYVVLPARAAREALEWARDIDPDVVLVDRGAGPGIGLVRDLHEHPDLNPLAPILLLCDDEVDRDTRVAAMSAGAWDAVTVPFDVEPTLLRLARMIASKREADDVLQEAWVEEATGLYSWQGLVDSAEALVTHSARYNRPIACIACGPDADAWDAATIGGLADAVRRTTRGSDILGVASQWAELLVLAPDTGEEGARLLALRLMAAMTEQGAAGTVRTGFFGLEDAAALEGEPADLLLRAARALRTAQAQAAPEPVRWTAEPAGDGGSAVTPR